MTIKNATLKYVTSYSLVASYRRFANSRRHLEGNVHRTVTPVVVC